MAIEYVDPRAVHGPLARAWQAFGSSSVGRWTGINIVAKVDPWLSARTGGRITIPLSVPTATLHSTGARSGEPRANPVIYFHDGNDVILIASSFGRDRHPAWYHNLKAHPEARLVVKGVEQRFRAEEVADEAERTRLYDLGCEFFPAYRGYRERTAAIGRRIPVLRLRPE